MCQIILKIKSEIFFNWIICRVMTLWVENMTWLVLRGQFPTWDLLNSRFLSTRQIFRDNYENWDKKHRSSINPGGSNTTQTSNKAERNSSKIFLRQSILMNLTRPRLVQMKCRCSTEILWIRTGRIIWSTTQSGRRETGKLFGWCSKCSVKIY